MPNAGPHLRAVFHHQGGGQGNRPRPRHRLRHRPAPRRVRPRVLRGRSGTHVSRLLPGHTARDQTRAPRRPKPIRGGSRRSLMLKITPAFAQLAFETLAILAIKTCGCDGEQALHAFKRVGCKSICCCWMCAAENDRPWVYACIQPSDLTCRYFSRPGTARISLRCKKSREGLPMLQKPYSPRDLARKNPGVARPAPHFN